MEIVEASKESDLVREVLNGSPTAFAQIVRLHQSRIRMVVSKWIRCPATADDIAQEVFLSAFQHMERRNSDGPLISWLIGIAKNKVKLHLRAELRREHRELAAYERKLQEWKLQSIDRELCGDVDEQRLLANCIERLGPEGQRVVKDHYFAGKTLESIAKESSRTGGALRMMLLRVRRALAECIRGEHGE